MKGILLIMIHKADQLIMVQNISLFTVIKPFRSGRFVALLGDFFWQAIGCVLLEQICKSKEIPESKNFVK